MAEDKQITPEQQLLKLIEEQNKSGAGPKESGSQSKAKIKTGGISLAKVPGQIAGRLAFWKRKSKKIKYAKKTVVGITTINKMLFLTVVALLLYVVYESSNAAKNLQAPPNIVPAKDLQGQAVVEMIEPLQEAAFYTEKMSARDIFKEGKREKAQSAEPVKSESPEAAEAIQNLALVGISWSSNPDAIVEDKATQRTFFVKRGQMIGDAVKVEAIFKDHVVVSYQDNEYEIR